MASHCPLFLSGAASPVTAKTDEVIAEAEIPAKTRLPISILNIGAIPVSMLATVKPIKPLVINFRLPQRSDNVPKPGAPRAYINENAVTIQPACDELTSK